MTAAWLRILGVLALCAAAACSRAPDEAPPAAGAGVADPRPLRIVASIPPLAGLSRELAPPGASIISLVQSGQSAHAAELTPSAVSGLVRADVVAMVGMGLEPRLERVLQAQDRPARFVARMDTAAGLDDAAPAHTHVDPDHDHAHDDPALDPHLWLDPSLVRAFIPSLREAIERAQQARGALDDAERARLDDAQRRLLERIDALDREFRDRLEPLRGRAIITDHNAYARLAARYGLRVAAVLRPADGVEPTPQAIALVAQLARQEQAAALFVEPQFDATHARRLADEVGLRLETLDPLGDGDWFDMMRANLDALERGLRLSD